MSNSILLTSNTTSTAITAGGTIPLGSAVHGYGRGIRLNGNEIDINAPGYYSITAMVNMAITAAEDAVINLCKNGSVVASANVTASAAGDDVSVTIPWVARKTGCGCVADAYTLTSSVAGTLASAVVKVERV